MLAYLSGATAMEGNQCIVLDVEVVLMWRFRYHKVSVMWLEICGLAVTFI